MEVALNPSVEARLFVFSECCDLRHQFEKLMAHGGSQATASSNNVTARGIDRRPRRLSARDPSQPLGDGLFGGRGPREYAARLTDPVGDYGSFRALEIEGAPDQDRWRFEQALTVAPQSLAAPRNRKHLPRRFPQGQSV